MMTDRMRRCVCVECLCVQMEMCVRQEFSTLPLRRKGFVKKHKAEGWRGVRLWPWGEKAARRAPFVLCS